MEKENHKNVFQKLVAFRANLYEAGGKNQTKLLEEQKAMVFFDDDIAEVAGRVYYRCTITFADIESSDTIKASSFSPVGLMQARGNALKALLGSAIAPKAEQPSDSITNDNEKSPTPARTPSEPSGGVPSGFRGFPK